MGKSAQFSIIRVGHWWEAFAQTLIIWPHKRIVPCQPWHVDMVANEHEITWPIGRIHAARGIGDNQRMPTELSHHAHRERQHLQRIPFIEMETPLHYHHRHVFKRPDDQATSMPYDGRTSKMRDLSIRNNRRLGNFSGEISQARTKYQGYRRFQRRARLDCASSLQNLVK